MSGVNVTTPAVAMIADHGSKAASSYLLRYDLPAPRRRLACRPDGRGDGNHENSGVRTARPLVPAVPADPDSRTAPRWSA
jgi:hypothetical protein